MHSVKSHEGDDAYPAVVALAILRRDHFLTGQLENPQQTLVPNPPFEQLFARVLGTRDPALFECLCPLLVFNHWTATALLDAVPEKLHGRLALAVAVATFLTDFDRQGLPDVMGTKEQLRTMRTSLATASVDQDPFEQRFLEQRLRSDFFAAWGLFVNWPLTDFVKQFEWTKQKFCHELRSQ